MKPVKLLAILAASVASANAANATTPNLLNELSPCALGCLAQSVPAAGCGFFDIDCQCTSPNLTSLVTECMLHNCTVEESFKLVQVDSIQCNRPRNSRNTAIAAAQTAACVITYVLIILRVVSRFWATRRLWWDDWFHVLAAIVAVPLNAFAFLLAKHGFGNHLWEIDPQDASSILMWFYFCQIFWAAAMYLIKVSILCLYLRIFPSPKFRIATYATMVFLTISSVVTIMLAIMQCTPVQAVWDLNIKNAKCLSITNVAYASAAFNIATEVIILILPMPVISSLSLSLKRKIGIAALFAAGALVIIVASARIPSLKWLSEFNDPTYQNVPAYIWTTAENVVANFCAAAPAMRSLFTQIKQFSSHHSSQSHSRTGAYRHYGGAEGDQIPLSSSPGGGIVMTSSISRNSTSLEKEGGSIRSIPVMSEPSIDPPPYHSTLHTTCVGGLEPSPYNQV